MSLTLDRPAAPQAAVPAPGLAQVNLLPPEIRARRALRRLSRWLLGGLSVVALVVAGGYVAATLEVGAAADELADAQSQTSALTVEQQSFAEVPAVLGRLSALQEARAQGYATEIAWSPYLDAVFAVMPEGVTITAVDVVGASPMLSAALPADPLQGPSVSRISFTGRSESLVDTAAWARALDSVPGFSDAWVSGATRAEDEAHGVHYQVSSSVQVTADAFTHRFAPEEN